VAGRFEYALATEDDDAALRRMLRQIAMPGDITLAFLREPSYFVAEQAGCFSSQILVCRDRQQDGRIVGMASRSVRDVYIDGSPARVGYLGMLRGVPESRGNIGLARGYQYLKRLHADGSVPYYFTTMLDENAPAMELLTSARGGLPIYHPFARLVTYLIPLTGRYRASGLEGTVTRVRREELDEAVAHLNEWNNRHQFAPVYTLPDILGETPLLPAFSWDNLYVCRNGPDEKIRGTLAVWDQESFKQTVVTAYSSKMQAVRPLYNLYAAVRGVLTLPPTGRNIKLLYAICVSGDAEAFAHLLRRALAESHGRGYDYLAVGFSAEHECAAYADRLATQRIKSTLYGVHWPDDAVTLPQQGRPVHTEVATL